MCIIPIRKAYKRRPVTLIHLRRSASSNSKGIARGNKNLLITLYTDEDDGITPIFDNISDAIIVVIGELKVEPISVFSANTPNVASVDNTAHTCQVPVKRGNLILFRNVVPIMGGIIIFELKFNCEHRRVNG